MQKKYFYIFTSFVVFFWGASLFYNRFAHHKKMNTDLVVGQSLAENTKIKISDDYYMTYSFSEKPKVGTTMLKVSLFDNDKNKVSSPKIFGNYDMPSMRGHHPSGEVVFSANKTNDYILPIHFVMRGGWEIILKIIEEESEIYVGHIILNI